MAVLQHVERTSRPVRRDFRQRAGTTAIHDQQWLARELHDSVAQTLTTMVIQIELAKAEQAGRRAALESLESLQTSARTVLSNLRQTMLTLRGEPTTGPTLDTWLKDVIDRFRAETGIETKLSGVDTWPLPLSVHTSINLCRIVEEALRNVRHYSGANEVMVTLSHDNGIARLCIKDDGRGRRVDDASAWLGLGTLGMKERAMLLGGELQIESAIGIGTTIEIMLPVENLIP